MMSYDNGKGKDVIMQPIDLGIRLVYGNPVEGYPFAIPVIADYNDE